MGSGFNAVGSILVRPFNRSGFAIVGADIAHDFAVQIFDRSKDAACDEIALNFREPDFDLIEPRRIGRRVMNAHLGMPSQEIADCLGLMRAQVIADDVRLAPGLGGRSDLPKRRRTLHWCDGRWSGR
jgi:hypothetical protein